jgi:sRNA-binding protein|tara:strand:+ start:388 stop:855 length:468 start_codon:yes stop_codon:yes gene_type:complete
MTQEWLAKRANAMNWLMNTFPESIGAKLPLKVGVFEEIRAFEAMDKPALVWIRRALWFHTSRASYLKKIIIGANRVELMGAIASDVLEEEAKNAKSRLAEIRKKQNEVKRKPQIKKQLAADQQATKAEALKKEEINPVTRRKILTLKKKPDLVVG